MTSETLVNINQTTQRNNPEDRNLHTHRCENLKSYKFIKLVLFFNDVRLKIVVEVPVANQFENDYLLGCCAV
jgi:hypothetical protein